MPVRQLGLMVNSFARASTCGTRLFALLDLDIDIKDAPDAKRSGRHRGRAALRQRRLPLSEAPASARRCPASRFEAQAGRDHRHRRPAGQRQVDHRPPDPALLRRRLAARITIDGQDIREVTLRIAAQGGRRGAAGLVPVHHHDREQHRLRQSVGAASSASSAPPNSRSCTTTSSGLPAGYEHRRRRARRVAVGRPAPAPVDRPQPDAAAGGDGVRRFHRGDRCRHRAAHPLGDEALRQGPRDAHHLAPAELADACRPDPVHRGRPRSSSAARTSELLALGGRYRALYDLQVRPEDERSDGGGSSLMSTPRPTTTKRKTGSRAPVEGRRRLAPRTTRRSSARPTTAHRPAHLELREALPQARSIVSVAAVLVFTLTQLAIPLIIRYAIDHGMAAGSCDRSVLGWAVAAFAVTILINYGASYVQEMRRRQGRRGRAVRHAPRHVRAPAAGLARASWTRPRSAG